MHIESGLRDLLGIVSRIKQGCRKLWIFFYDATRVESMKLKNFHATDNFYKFKGWNSVEFEILF